MSWVRKNKLAFHIICFQSTYMPHIGIKATTCTAHDNINHISAAVSSHDSKAVGKSTLSFADLKPATGTCTVFEVCQYPESRNSSGEDGSVIGEQPSEAWMKSLPASER